MERASERQWQGFSVLAQNTGFQSVCSCLTWKRWLCQELALRDDSLQAT